jgi:hypothetical protein
VADGQTRRAFIQTGLAAAGSVALGPAFWRDALAAPAKPGPGPYGPPVGAPDELGLILPEGFGSRLIAKAGTPLPGTAYDFPVFPDGAATFPLSDGGWILAVNSESPPRSGGASGIRFAPGGSVGAAYRILSGTSTNCAGGRTPWGTWMSCEEVDRGVVWECDPAGAEPAVARPAMGVFKHEAVAVDPRGRRIYLTEDVDGGGFYRFTPARYPDCSAGRLEIAYVDANGVAHWNRVPDPSAATTPTRGQAGMIPFRRGEGIWFDGGIVYVATTSDSRIHAYDPLTETIEVVYDRQASDGPLSGVDNVTAAPSGDIYVCEDNSAAQLDIGILTPEGEVARFLTATGSQHSGSELTGVCFDPSGRRMYFGSQRGLGGTGAVFEVTGPFRERHSDLTVGGGLRLKAYAARLVSIDRFREAGMAVEVTASRSVEVVVKVGAAFDGTRVTLARRKAKLTAGRPERLRLVPGPAGRGRLTGDGELAGHVSVSAADPATGKREGLRRDVRLVRIRPG